NVVRVASPITRFGMLPISDHRVTIYIVFFFQAEDGIRDRNVTGVQTCALPISLHKPADVRQFALSFGGDRPSLQRAYGKHCICRSEERRVGKECRSRRSSDP